MKSSQPNMLLISPFSKGDILLNKIDSLIDVIGLDYLKRRRPIYKDGLIPSETYPNLRSIIQISTKRIPKTQRFVSSIKFGNEELAEFIKSYKIEEKAKFFFYSREVKISNDINNKDELCLKEISIRLKILIRNLKIKDFSVIGSYCNEGIAFIYCLLLPILTSSQIIFLEDRFDDSMKSIDFIFIRGDRLNEFKERFNMTIVKSLVIFTNDTDENIRNENENLFNESLTKTKIFIVDE